MSLTKEDLQAMKDAFKPEFNAIHKTIEDIAAELIKCVGDLHDDHEKRIRHLEQATR